MTEAALAALAEGRAVVAPTDTVYGLLADARSPDATAELWRLKQRPSDKPCAAMAAGIEALRELIPELELGAAEALLPGPFTLVVANPAGRVPWLCGDRPATVGIRVPLLPASTLALLERHGPVASTSANLHGGPDPCSLEGVPRTIREGAGAVLDGGELPGIPSTVIDLTGPQPVVLREGAVPAAAALERIRVASR